MKILHIHSSLAGGGIEAMICGLANEMVKTEDVTVCSIFEPKESDVFYHKLSEDVKKVSCHKKEEGFSVKEVFKIAQTIRKGKYDVVNMHGFMYYYMLAIILSVFTKTKFFYTVHSSADRESYSWDIKLFKLKRYFFKKKWVCPITISQISKDSFTKVYSCESQLIYNGIPTPIIAEDELISQYRFTEKTKVFIHPGRISKAKNQEVLCRVFKRLLDEGKDVVLLIAGSADNKDIMAAISPFFCDRIIYLGLRTDIPQLMAQSDAMCLSSIWEGLPVTLLEAIAVGCIPICSPVGGIVNVIDDGENGILSSSSSEDDYYEAIERFLALNDIETSKMKQLAIRSFEKFKIEHIAKEYLNHYQEAQ